MSESTLVDAAAPRAAAPRTETTCTFTSESVAEGHPDKVCDLIADSILAAYLGRDPRTRVACEVLCKSGTVVLAGEIRSPERVDRLQVVRQAIREIGYTTQIGNVFNDEDAQVLCAVIKQSPDIAQGVDERAAESSATPASGRIGESATSSS